MFKIALLLACIPALAFAQVKNCNSGTLPENIRNNVCEIEADRCQIEIGVSIEFEMDFIAPTDSASALPSVKGYLGIVSIPIELDEASQDGCNFIVDAAGSPGCPLVAGEFYTYKMDLVVESLPLSGINVDVEVALDGDNGRQTCFRFPAAI